MDSQFFKTLPRRSAWRSAAPRTRAWRGASYRLKTLVAFVVDQVLLFWPPYRHEQQDQDKPPD